MNPSIERPQPNIYSILPLKNYYSIIFNIKELQISSCMVYFLVMFACNWALKVTPKIMKKKILLLSWQIVILIAIYIKVIKNISYGIKLNNQKVKNWN